MSLSWIKIGSRAAVLIIIYLLLSIPDTKYQYFGGEVFQVSPVSSVTDILLTKHITSIQKYSDDEKSRQYDSLVTLLSNNLIALKSEILDSNDPIIDNMTANFGLASAIVSLSSEATQPILESLWVWRQYLKEQSLFWSNNDADEKLHIASTMNFVGICEDFIVTSRNLVYTKLTTAPVSLDPASTLSKIRSGDFILSSNDISYSYLEQAKFIPQLTTSLGFVLINADSSLYVSTTPNKGLHIIRFNEFIGKPYAKRLQLRLRADLPELISNPVLPHQAANFIYTLAKDLNIDYDFSLNKQNRSSLCEIGMLRFAYEGQNMNFTTSYSPVNAAYVYGLNRLGIKNETHATASEILFNPAIEVIGQQLSGEGIKTRNLEMASTISVLTIIDAKLMKSLRWRLPYHRMLKGYSSLTGFLGATPVIPNGMAPETAVIHDYINNQNEEVLPLLINKAAQFESENQYFPPYSMLCEMAITILAAKERK